MADPAAPVPARKSKTQIKQEAVMAGGTLDDAEKIIAQQSAPVPASEAIGELLDNFENAARMVGSSRRDSINEEYDAERSDARFAILALVSRLRSQVQRMTGELEAAEQHVTILREQLRADVLTPEEARALIETIRVYGNQQTVSFGLTTEGRFLEELDTKLRRRLSSDNSE